MTSSSIGQKIYNLRKKQKLTLEKLADMADCSKSYIWELENRTPPRPSADKLSKIAATLGVTMDYFIDDELPEEDAVDQMFYRSYRKMDPEVKDKIRQMVKLWQDE